MEKCFSRFIACALIALALVSSGCASVIHGCNQTIAVKSKPDGAKATFYSQKTGEAVSAQYTPCIVVLPRKDNEKDDYASFEIDVHRKLSGWYFGNVVFGISGVVGFLIDPLTGAIWTLGPDEITVELASSQSGQQSTLVAPVPAKKRKNAQEAQEKGEMKAGKS